MSEEKTTQDQTTDTTAQPENQKPAETVQDNKDNGLNLEALSGLVEAAIQKAMKDFKPNIQQQESLEKLGIEPVKEEPKQGKDAEIVTTPQDNELQETLAAMKTMLRDTLVTSAGVPEALLPLVPSDPVKAKEFLSSEHYTKIKTALSFKPPETKTETETKTDDKTTEAERKVPDEVKYKTFEDLTSAQLANELRGLI